MEGMKYHFSELKENRGNLKPVSAFWKFWWCYIKETFRKLSLTQTVGLVRCALKIGRKSG
jgi:hypothetical protein